MPHISCLMFRPPEKPIVKASSLCYISDMKRTIMTALLVLFPLAVSAAEFRVTPIRIDFGKGAKSAIVNVINDGPKTNLQIYAMEWKQDAEGKDVYTKTDDIIYFPKVLILEKGETRIIRAGMKTTPAAVEKTYRLFIEEIPSQKKKEGVNIVIAIKFGVPVFVEPLKETFKAEISGISMSKGVLKAIVKNTGTSHINIESISIRGTGSDGREILNKDLSGWYLLSGVTRAYTTEIPKDVCRGLGAVSLKLKSDRLKLDGQLNADNSMCGS